MSNLTVGKIVNNSVTLILSSADQDGFGEKIFTGNNFTMTTAETPAGRYKVKTGETEANTDNTVFTTTFDYLIRGDNLTDTITKNTFVAGKYYVVTDDPQVDGGPSTARSIFGIAQAPTFIQHIANKKVLLAVLDSGEGGLAANDATAHEVILQSTGAEFTLHADFTATPATDIQNSAFTKEAFAISSVDYNNCEYTISVPNETSFPGKTRCLCQVQSLFHKTYGDAVAYVIIPEMSSHNNFIQGRRVVGALPTSWTSQSSSSLLDTGTMCQNPFGTQLKVQIFDVNTHKILGTDQRHSQGKFPLPNVIEKWPTTIVLRLLFLDNEDLKDF